MQLSCMVDFLVGVSAVLGMSVAGLVVRLVSQVLAVLGISHIVIVLRVSHIAVLRIVHLVIAVGVICLVS